VPNNDPNSIDDIDLMGVYMAPPEEYLSAFQIRKPHTEKFINEWDVVNYEYKKFVGMLLKSNPNVLGMLWLRPNHYIETTPIGKILIANRNLFVSKKVYYSFTNYADSQIKKMTRFSYEGYMGQKRKSLVDKFGYDCKNAAHCIRLLKMGIEFLVDGQLNVFRSTDAKWLLNIKTGGWTLEEVKAEAERLFKLADEAYVRSTLPVEPKYDEIDKVVQDTLYDYLRENYNKWN
jgi:predicted nucleotidyltransferase